MGRLANAALVINILPTLDDLERALTSVDSHLAGLTWIDGIWLIYRKLQAVLEASGVKQINTEGQEFDPRFHEAVMTGEGEENKIISEVQKGYMLGDRVIRPAAVVVGRGQGGRRGPVGADGVRPSGRVWVRSVYPREPEERTAFALPVGSGSGRWWGWPPE